MYENLALFVNVSRKNIQQRLNTNTVVYKIDKKSQGKRIPSLCSLI